MGVRILGSFLKLYNLTADKAFYFSSLWNLPGGSDFKSSIPLVRTMSSNLSPSSSVRGMKHLQKELFDKRVSVPCLIVPVASIVQVKPVLKSYLLKIQNFRPIQELPIAGDSGRGNIVFTKEFLSVSKPSKIAVLDPSKISTYDDIKSEDRNILSNSGIVSEHFLDVKLDIGYDNWKADEILRAIIPEEFDSVSSYSICGHIIHLNLRDHLLEYKEIIGQVLLEKVINCRTVVNKTDNIDTTYRTFNMELLCGDNDMVAYVKENKCTFIFDFSKVYWNSRLSTEHERIVSYIKRGDVLYDVFCGVGPFSIPAARKGCRVLANDLNPESVRWLQKSCKANKTDFHISNKDGRDFILSEIKNDLLGIDFDSFKGDIHIVMNLPGLAVDFLEHFRGLFDRNEFEKMSGYREPNVYVYCFTKGEEDPASAAKQLVQTKLNYTFNDELIGVHFVRNVAPMKEMMRVSFKLSNTILTTSKRLNEFIKENDCKKICTESVQ